MHENLHHRHRHAIPLFILILLLRFHSTKSEIQSFKISSDHRPFILLQDFGFDNPGYISISISSVSITAPNSGPVSPTQLSFMGCFYGPTPARQAMELAVLKDICIIGSPFIFPILTFDESTILPKSHFNKTVFINIPDLYYIFLINCAKNSSISMTLNLETYNINSDGGRDYLDEHFINLPATLFSFATLFLVFFLLWSYGCMKNKHFVHKIHVLMALLLFSRFVELLSYGYSQRSISQTGSPHGWNIFWLSVFLTRSILFINVIMLIRAGWSLFRPCLQENEKYVIATTVVLQVIAGVCFVLIQGFGPSNKGYKYWTVTYYTFDFICSAFVMFPVCKAIDNLGSSSKAEGKEAKMLVYQRVYENLAIAIYVYLGLTRLGMFVLRAVTGYNFWCLSIALEMMMEFVFYVVVYVMFWPNARYDYVVLDDGDEDSLPGKIHTKAKIGHSTMVRKPNENIKILVTISVGIMIGFFLGVSVPKLPSAKINITSFILHDSAMKTVNESTPDRSISDGNENVKDVSKIWVPTNPKGAERLPSGIVASESDLYLRRLWGLPSEDFPNKPNYLVTFTVGYNQMANIDKAVKKFSDNFTIVLFHYDGRTTEWDDFEWSKRAIHISVSKQTKWWYAKRFLHPDIVAPYDYIFVWDEDLGLENFNAEEYIKLVRKHGLEISQPALEPTKKMPWQMTRRRDDLEVHKNTTEKPGFCSDPQLPPCAAFVEIMAPVFSREAWRCVWHIIQNDLVHGWGLDFALQKCVEPAHEKIGVVDAQWIIHQTIPSLGNQGEPEQGKNGWRGVRLRCTREWKMFKARMDNAEKAYYQLLRN